MWPRARSYYFVLLVALVACARPGSLTSSSADSATGIVAGQAIARAAGTNASDAVSQSTVLLLILNRQESALTLTSVCSGTLITRNLVLTAAHCMNRVGADRDPMDPESVLVHFGNYHEGDAVNGPATLAVQAIRLHDDFSLWNSEHGLLGHDLALVRLRGSIPPGFAPAARLPRAQALKSAQRVVVAGFGSPTATGSFDREELRRYDGYKVSAVAAKSSVVRLKSEVSGGIADGDSGGPAFLQQGGELRLWGVASSSYTGDHQEAFFEDLRASSGWLTRAAAELGSPLKQP